MAAAVTAKLAQVRQPGLTGMNLFIAIPLVGCVRPQPAPFPGKGVGAGIEEACTFSCGSFNRQAAGLLLAGWHSPIGDWPALPGRDAGRAGEWLRPGIRMPGRTSGQTNSPAERPLHADMQKAESGQLAEDAKG